MPPVLKKYKEFFKFFEAKTFSNRIINIYDTFFKNLHVGGLRGGQVSKVCFISLNQLIKQIIREEIRDSFKLSR